MEVGRCDQTLPGFFPKLFLTAIHRYNSPQRKSSVPSRFVLELILCDRRRDEVTQSARSIVWPDGLRCGFANLPFAQRIPARSQQSPEHMAAVSASFDELRRRHCLGLDPPLELFVRTSIGFDTRTDFKSPGDSLALRELEAPAGFLLAVFLALDDARIAGQETFFLENGAQIRLVIDKRLGKAVAHGARLA
jgi:hypothetical protein